MTDEQILIHYSNMQEIFGEALPNPEHSPKQFEYFVKLYKYFYVEPEPTV
jgi:hypothetical protein